MGGSDKWIALKDEISNISFPSSKLQFKGYSLQRISFDVDGSKIYNWQPHLATPSQLFKDPRGEDASILPVIVDIDLDPKKKIKYMQRTLWKLM